MKKTLIFVFAALLPAAIFSGCNNIRSSKDSEKALAYLEEGWKNPPQSSRPRVWWHWMNGNITKDGIKADLLWMDRIGLGGFHNFDAAMATPQIVPQRLIYMDEGWQDAFGYAVHLADSLGLEATIASSPGWSTTGGPWVSPEDGMKKLTWRSMVTDGGKIAVRLPEPFKTTGAFQNGPIAGRGFAGAQYEHYEDIAVLAVRQPEGYETLSGLGAKITSSGGSFTLTQLTDGDVVNSSLLPSAPGGFGWIMYEFDEPQTVRAVTLADGSTAGPGGGSQASAWLESSHDGRNFSRIAPLPAGGTVQRTISVPPATARYFRVAFNNPQAPRGFFFGGGPVQAPKGTQIAELELHTVSRVNFSEDKAGFAARSYLSEAATPTSDEVFPSTADVVDVTAFVKDGVLSWDAPQGRWKIYRFGWSLTGKQNHPATAEATGLEVDKLDPEAWTRFFRTYLDMYKKASGGLLGGHGVQYILNDSYEAEQENWTPAMAEEFAARRGYELMPWLPVLAGEVIGSPRQSDAFLWDWRMTISDLISANYDLLTKIAQEEYGMAGRYTESHEAGRVYVVDGMDVKRTSQVPMSAMWVTAPWLPTTPSGDINRTIYNLDGLESASVAHIYGQNVAAAESMTAPGGEGRSYAYHPGNLKFVADIELSNGINRFVIHESAHQPDDVHVPGLSLGGIGQWFNRHESWAEQAGAWTGYLSRSCFMLQAGKNVADILIYYGEDDNIIGVYGNSMPDVPAGWRYDFASPDVLLNQVVSDGRGGLKARSGVQYRVLWLDKNTDYMSISVLRRIGELASDGVTICGNRPRHRAGMAGTDEEFEKLAATIWNSGKKNVTTGVPVGEVLASIGAFPDFSASTSSTLNFLHRSLPGAEIYWVNKPSASHETVKASFRTAGLRPAVWHPESGVVDEVSYEVRDGRTIVQLDMVPDDAVFVVFAGKGRQSYKLPETVSKVAAVIGGPWTVSFQEGRGAPAEAVFGSLRSYTESDDPGIKYFSGVATYKNTFGLVSVPSKAVLDLGTVADLAEVYVNGQYCGTAWKQPYMVDVAPALREGDNELEVRVANVWVNRLIGDEQPDCRKKITWTDSGSGYRASSPLNPAGLLGPVKLIERNTL